MMTGLEKKCGDDFCSVFYSFIYFCNLLICIMVLKIELHQSENKRLLYFYGRTLDLLFSVRSANCFLKASTQNKLN